MPPATRIRAFLLVFLALFLLSLIMVVAAEFSDAQWIKTALNIAEAQGRLTFLSIATTFILVEGVPMLAAWLRKAEINEAREEGRALEREAWQAWRRKLEAWEQHKAQAAEGGRDFTEPRPAPPDEE